MPVWSMPGWSSTSGDPRSASCGTACSTFTLPYAVCSASLGGGERSALEGPRGKEQVMWGSAMRACSSAKAVVVS